MKGGNLEMKKKPKLFVFYVTILALTGVLSLGTLAAVEFIDEAMELEKLYMQDETMLTVDESPINVVIEETEKRLSNENETNTEYSFEKSLMDEKVEDLFLKNSKKISREISNTEKRTVNISAEEYQLVDNFTEAFLNTYVSKELPDFNIYYDQSNKIREENRFLIEAYIYDLAIIKDNIVESFERELNIAKVTPLTENVDEVIFYLVQKLHTNEGDENGGKWFVANIIKTENEYKFINIWVEDPEYEMMQNQLKDDYLKKNIPLEKERLNEDLLKQQKEKAELEKSIVLYDDFSDKISNLSYKVRKTTLSYDRQAVAKAAKKYAYNYNTLFTEYTGVGGDCTNFVSQCIWQSPGWGFDRIGKNNSVKWACKKNSMNKYAYETVSWVGVNELWTYLQTNDSPSQAGTVYGVSATTSGYNSSNVQLGDVIQLYNGNKWVHSIIVSEITDGIVYCAAHTGNYDRRKLSEYINNYPKYRVAHINSYITSY